MAQQIKRLGMWMLLLAPLVVLAVLLVPQPPAASGAPFSTPFWTNNTPSMECFCASPCGCEGPEEWSFEDVNNRTGELRHRAFLTSLPGKKSAFSVSLDWRSYISGGSQFAQGWIPSWEITAVKVIDISGDPEGAWGHHVIVRYSDGRMGVHDWSGTAYVAASCLDTDVVSRPSGTSGPYRVTSRHGERVDFNADGMPETLWGSRILLPLDARGRRVNRVVPEPARRPSDGTEGSGSGSRRERVWFR